MPTFAGKFHQNIVTPLLECRIFYNSQNAILDTARNLKYTIKGMTRMQTQPPRLLTIGSSCINRFQFDFFQDRTPDTAHYFVRSLFESNIISLVGTEAILQLALKQELLPAIQDISAYHVAWDAFIFNRHLPDVCFYHETETAQNFAKPGEKERLVSKLCHQAGPLVQPRTGGRMHLIWSNIQPNLPHAVENLMAWQHFQLTEERYQTIKSLACALFGSDTRFTFISVAQDLDPGLAHEPDVQIVDLPRGDTYEGPPRLFDTLLSEIISKASA